MKLNDFLNTLEEAKSEKMPVKELIKLLKKLNFKINHEDELTSKKSNVVVNPLKGFYETRKEASEALMKATAAHKPTIEWAHQGRRPIVSFAKWKVQISKIEGAKQVKAADYEEAIAAAWNDAHGYEHSIKVKKETKEVGKKIAQKIKKDTEGKARPTGEVRVKAVSEFWKKHTTRANRTPKTDILWEGPRVSLKMGKKTQLCSAKIVGGEGEAILWYALQASGAEDKLVKDVSEIFDAKKLAVKPPKTSKELEQYKLNHKAIESAFRNVINTHPKFRNAFVREALTGEGKFQGVALEPIANIVLAASFDGDRVAWHPITDEYIAKIAPQVEIGISFKSFGSSKYSALRGHHTRPSDDIQHENQITEREMICFCEEHGIDISMNEDVKAAFGRMFNMLKATAQKGIDLLFKLLSIDVDVKFTHTGIDFF